MVNYIIADYKRVISRIPRSIFLVLFEAIFAFYIIYKWKHTGGNYNSVTIVKHSELFFQLWFFFLTHSVFAPWERVGARRRPRARPRGRLCLREAGLVRFQNKWALYGFSERKKKKKKISKT